MKIQKLLVPSVFILIFYCFGYSQTTIEMAKTNFVSDPSLQHASIGICVYDLVNNQKLVGYNENTSIATASTAKLFATATAIEILGVDYRPKTRLYSEAKIDENGNLKGNLWIRGGGDVSLGSRYYNKDGEEADFLKRWADTLYALGLRKIEGDLIGDGSEYGYQGAPDGWNWGDMGNYYGTGPCGLPIYDNILRCYFTVSKKIGVQASLIRTFPVIENLNFQSYIISANIKGDDSYIYGAPYSYDRFGTGYLPKNAGSFMVKGSLPDPEMQFANEFKRILLEKGIELTGGTKGVRTMNLPHARTRYSSLKLLYSYSGRDIKSIAKWTNTKSVNLFAEQLICWVAFEKTGYADTKTATDYMERYWASKINTRGLNLKDGSGLSRNNAINAENFCSLLSYMYRSSSFTDFYATLPIAGETGTISSLCYKQAGHGRIRAKSGTMNKIKSYAGYIETSTGKKLVFSIMVNNYSCSNEAIVTKMEQFLNVLAVY